MAEVSVFAGMTGKNRHFRDLSQQVLSGVVAGAEGIAARAQSPGKGGNVGCIILEDVLDIQKH